MVEITAVYDGHQRSTAVHGPSGAILVTDAPIDNGGKGEGYSPTDLLVTGLGTCMLTYLGKAGDRYDWDLRAARIVLKKEMIADPMRRVGRIVVDIHLPRSFDDKEMKVLTNAVTTCPVKLSISDLVEVPITFHLPE